MEKQQLHAQAVLCEGNLWMWVCSPFDQGTREKKTVSSPRRRGNVSSLLHARNISQLSIGNLVPETHRDSKCCQIRRLHGRARYYILIRVPGALALEL